MDRPPVQSHRLGGLHADEVERAADGVGRGSGQRQPEAAHLRVLVQHEQVVVDDVEVAGQLVGPRDHAVRGAQVGGLLHHARPLGQPLDDVALLRLRVVAAGVGRHLLALGQLLAQDAVDAGVRVLHVVDRVLAGALAGQVDVDVERLVVGAGHEEVAQRVDADGVGELVDRDDVAAALAHALAGHRDHLVQQHLDPLGVVPQAAGRGLQPPHVAVVVGAEHVEQALVAARQLVLDVGEVGPEVRGRPVGAHEHAVLVVAEGRRAQPRGPVAILDVAGRAGLGDGAVDGAGGVQLALGEPEVHADADALERGADTRDHALGAERRPLLDRGVEVEVERGRELGDLGARVAALGRLLAALAGAQRLAEQVDLAARVVEVVLPRDVVAGEGQQPRHGVAVGGVAAGADREVARRVGGHELDQQALGAAARAVALALGQDRRQRPAEPRRREPQVEEAGAGDVDGVEVVGGDARADLRREVARRALHLLGQAQRDGRGVVAVRRVRRPLQGHGGRREVAEGDGRACDRRFQGGEQVGHRGMVAKGGRPGRRPDAVTQRWYGSPRRIVVAR